MTLKNADEGEAYRLDPRQFPRRLELELSEEVLEAMQKLADATGRSVSEIATDILSRGIEEHPPATD
jgi:hypothetical protein